MSLSAGELLNRSRRELLDLSNRNRLLSIPVNTKSARIVQVQNELSERVFQALVTDKKAMIFSPGQGAKENPADDSDDEEIGLAQPEDEYDDKSGLPKRHVDLKLQTALSPEGLQRRLLDLFQDSQTIVEEQGVNILYLALGQLKWFEAEQADTPRFAPLILIPVELQRKSATERFQVRWREEDIQGNLSLEAKLKLDFDIELPVFPEEEEFSLDQYFNQISKAVANAKTWEVLPNAITLGFFSFAKFLMYRDLDPENWPEQDRLLKHPLVTGLLVDGFPHGESLIPEDSDLDVLIPAAKLDHVVDADSSQTLAIEMVRQGRNLVIQGPPGTGKSQSITNIIASAVLDGKKVLFVAEKLAALEVVKRRLEREGLGPLCLELHSNKSKKRAVIEEIGKAWELGRPKASALESVVSKLEQKRALLNRHSKSIHEKLDPSGLTPFLIMGHLARLGDASREVADIVFEKAELWAAEDCVERRKLIGELAARVQQIGLPSRHPWRGVCRETILNIDFDLIEKGIRTAADKLSQLRDTALRLAAELSQSVPDNFVETEKLRTVSDYVAKAPPLDKKALCSGVWNAGLEGLKDLLSVGRKFSSVIAEIGSKVRDSIWEGDFSKSREHIAIHGKSLFRIFNRDYRNSIAAFRAGLVVELPKTYTDRLGLADQIIQGQQTLRAIRNDTALGESAFGTFWRAEKTNWDQLESILDWVARQKEAGLDAEFRQLFVGVQDQNQVGRLVEEIAKQLLHTRGVVEKLASELSLDWMKGFATPEVGRVSFQALSERFTTWLDHLEDSTRWSNYFVRSQQARALGMGALVDCLESEKVEPTKLIDCFDRIYYSQLLRNLVRQKPELAQFDGVLHSSHVGEFRELDQDRLALAKFRVLSRHYEKMPAASGIGATGIVKSELERKRGHRAVRRLLKDTGSVIQSIKPVFMMSPLSVAQFLEPGAVEFDLLVIDEASQVQPVDAFGAIARCKQIVVVGDSKQLPPTRFFSRLTTNSEELEEEEDSTQTAEAKDIESILGLCCARGIPETMLRWHYRSRHHSLIAVSNHEFYESQLFIVPSPYLATAGLGLKFHHIPEGVFDSGGTGTNRVEAKAICRAIVEHARKSPTLSLGVATFSIRQRQAILDELELLRREIPELEAFFSRDPTEPFFVKNLESVQGDERDVIFISVGYGRNSSGYMAMRFGPLSNEGGERRLNVLISRAKKSCEVFSSITADDIDLERASGRGVAALKAFLSFAQTGRLSIAKRSGLEEQSPLEEAICRAVESLGYEVHPQVGLAGFFIDLAVVDREQRGRYILGIECDGAAYHSSRSARDRDRLRQAVLEDHGWVIHRVWSTDWFQHPSDQLRKIAESIERVKRTTGRLSEEIETVSVESSSDEKILREVTAQGNDEHFGIKFELYLESNFEVPRNKGAHKISTKEMSEIIFRVVEREGPIHEDEVTIRIRNLWNLGRTGARIQSAVTQGIQSLLAAKKCEREEDFLLIPGVQISPRNREWVCSATLRKPEMIAPAEIRAAILALLNANHGATKQEVFTTIARLLGFKSTSGQLRELIGLQITKLQAQGKISEDEGMLKIIENDSER